MIIKCLYNLFLAIKRTGRISLADCSDLQCHATISQSICWYTSYYPVNNHYVYYVARGDKLWIAMEYCGGGSLQDIILLW